MNVQYPELLQGICRRSVKVHYCRSGFYSQWRGWHQTSTEYALSLLRTCHMPGQTAVWRGGNQRRIYERTFRTASKRKICEGNVHIWYSSLASASETRPYRVLAVRLGENMHMNMYQTFSTTWGNAFLGIGSALILFLTLESYPKVTQSKFYNNWP